MYKTTVQAATYLVNDNDALCCQITDNLTRQRVLGQSYASCVHQMMGQEF